MQIEIQRLSKSNLKDVNRCDGSFMVDSHLVLSMQDGMLTYSAVSVKPYKKEFPIEEMDVDSFVENVEKAIFLAYVDGTLAGQIDVVKWWNGYAYVNAFAVNPGYRKHGVGRALLQKMIDWARENGLPGVMLETQNNNAPACALYQKCGFTLSGFDRYLFKGLDPETQEIALFWYLLFDGSGKHAQGK
jgi:GNAT superfamily N-acetyltransferase